MKTTLYLVIALAVLCVAPIYAQSAFTDVPSEHWAYDAVESLQAKGILQGYPDGTFQGKRTMSRYELATVVARLLQQMPPMPSLDGYVTKQEMADAIAKIPIGTTVTSAGPDLSIYATKDDVAAIRKLVDGFKDELQSLGVDVDQVKRDLAALSARVDAIETELKRVRFTGEFNVVAKVYSDNTRNTDYAATGAILRDIDGRIGNPINNAAGHTGSSALRDMSVYRDFDLNLVGRVNENTTAMATINFGNYINYLNSGSNAGASDAFTPYYMCIATDLGFGNLTVGRFPLQLGAYTFKMPVADSYVSMAKTDSGNRPVDGAMLKTGLLGIDWTFFAAQHDKVPTYTGFGTPVYGVPFTQSAGARLEFGAPMGIRLGGTYYQGWDKTNYKTASVDLYEYISGDLSVPISFVDGMGLTGSWTQANQKALGVKVVDDDNEAWEARLAFPIAGLKLGVGYRDIGGNFMAPGAWDKIAYVNNPTNVKGFNGDLAYNFSDKFSVNVGGQMLKLRENQPSSFGLATKDDEINQIKAGVNYAFSSNDDLGLNVEWVDVDANSRPVGFDKPEISYISLDWGRKIGENASLKVGYQLIEFKSGVKGVAPDSSFKGSVGAVQLGVSF